MSFFNVGSKRLNPTSPSPDNPSVVMYILAAICMPFVQSAKWFKERVYSGWEGGFREFFGFVFGVAAGIGTGYGIGWVHSFNWLAWLSAGVAAWAATLYYLWPAVYLFIVHPVYRFCNAVYDRVHAVTSKYFGKIATGLLSAIRSVCIGSGSAWNRVLDKEHGPSWFIGLLGFLAYVANLALAGLAGWEIFQLHLFAWALLNYACLGTLTLAAALLICGIGFQLIETGETAFIALLSGGAALYGLAPFIAKETAFAGSAATIAACAVAFVALVGYVFPFVTVILTNGFWSRLWKQIEPLNEKTYGDNDRDYTTFFHHLVNLLCTAAVISISISTCGAAGLSLAATAACTLVAAAITYLGAFQLINHSAGNVLLGVASAIGVGVWCGQLAEALPYGIVGGVVAGVLSALVYGLVLLPLVYVGFKTVAQDIGLSELGGILQQIYATFNKGFQRLLNEVAHAYRRCYDDKSTYNELFVQVSNIAIAAAVFHYAHALVGGTLGMALSVLSAILSYTLAGKVLLLQDFGLQCIGAITSLVSGLLFGTGFYAAHHSGGGETLAVMIGLAVCAGTYALGFPIVYVVIRLLTGWLQFATPALRAVHNWFWARFLNFWNGCVAAYNLLLQVVTPIWQRIARAYNALRAAYGRLLDRIRGK